MDALLTKGKVKMAGYRASFFCVFMDREVEVSRTAKKNESNIQPRQRAVYNFLQI